MLRFADELTLNDLDFSWRNIFTLSAGVGFSSHLLPHHASALRSPDHNDSLTGGLVSQVCAEAPP